MTTAICLGLSHRTAPLQLRESLAPSADSLAQLLAGGHAAGLLELAIVSTCNRLEFYATLPDDRIAPLTDHIRQVTGRQVDAAAEYVYVLRGVHAAEHLCRVAAGLDSQVLGEAQILGQVTAALEEAEAAGAAGMMLRSLFRTAITAGKRARTETRIGHRSLSISSLAACEVAEALGSLNGRHILVLGAGQMARLAVKALIGVETVRLTVLNRTPDHAQSLAQWLGGEVAGLDQLPARLAEVDAIIAATSAPAPIIMPDMLAARQGRPLVIADLGLPRNVDPASATVPGVHLINIDALKEQATAALAARESQVGLVEQIVAQELRDYLRRQRQLRVRPVIAEWRQQAEAIRRQELARTLRHLPELDDETQEHLHHLTRALVNKLLHEPTRRLRTEAVDGDAEPYAEAIRYLFALSEDQTRG